MEYGYELKNGIEILMMSYVVKVILFVMKIILGYETNVYYEILLVLIRIDEHR